MTCSYKHIEGKVNPPIFHCFSTRYTLPFESDYIVHCYAIATVAVLTPVPLKNDVLFQNNFRHSLLCSMSFQVFFLFVHIQHLFFFIYKVVFYLITSNHADLQSYENLFSLHYIVIFYCLHSTHFNCI